MNVRVLLAMAGGALVLSTAASAENYFVRNRPFTQVVTAAGETFVGAEAFLRALGLNWTVEGNVVTLTEMPAANPSLAAGALTYRYGKNEVVLDGSARGGSCFVPMRPLAKLLEYSVMVNRVSGTVDVQKARFSSEAEKQMVGQVVAARESEKQAVAEAWTRKANELKEKRQPKEEGKENSGEESQSKEGKPDSGKSPASVAEAQRTETPPAATQPAADPKAGPGKAEVKEVPKEARLEVFRSDASPDPSTGTVTITCEVKNQGDAPSKAVSATLILTGPERGGSVIDNANTARKVWMSKTLTGPVIQPGGNWQFVERYRHPSGNSMPIGNITAELKLK